METLGEGGFRRGRLLLGGCGRVGQPGFPAVRSLGPLWR